MLTRSIAGLGAQLWVGQGLALFSFRPFVAPLYSSLHLYHTDY